MVKKGFTQFLAILCKIYSLVSDKFGVASWLWIFVYFVDQVKEKVEARNELESYTYSLKNQIGDKEKLGGKLSDEDKTTVEEAVEKVCI